VVSEWQSLVPDFDAIKTAAKNRVVITHSTDVEDFSNAICNAAMLEAKDNFSKVRLAVEWQDSDRLRGLLNMLPAWKPERTQLLISAL
jgi:hypothetical protein